MATGSTRREDFRMYTPFFDDEDINDLRDFANDQFMDCVIKSDVFGAGLSIEGDVRKMHSSNVGDLSGDCIDAVDIGEIGIDAAHPLSVDGLGMSSSEMNLFGDLLSYTSEDMKPEIRNCDCMWSPPPSHADGGVHDKVVSAAVPIGGAGGCSGNISAASSLNDSVAVPLSMVTNSASATAPPMKQQKQRHPTTAATPSSSITTTVTVNASAAVKAGKSKAALAMAAMTTAVAQHKAEPLAGRADGDFEQQLQQHSIPHSKGPTSKGAQALPRAHLLQNQSLQHIPPGTSLLRKQNPVALRRQQQQSGRYVRPDTPHSLDEGQFKHNVDLGACVMGSNNIALSDDDALMYICQQLQDSSKPSIDLRLISSSNQNTLTDVLGVIEGDSGGGRAGQANANCRSIGSLSPKSEIYGDNDEDEEEEVQGGVHDDTDLRIQYNMPHKDDEEDDEDDDDEDNDDDDDDDEEDEDDYEEVEEGYESQCGDESSAPMYPQYQQKQQQAPAQGRRHGHAYMDHYHQHSDHSYTRCKDGMDDVDVGASLETPSDSDEEEIDVVSIGDKKLPTNPSAKDRRMLQTKVASKFSNPNIVKNANGVRTIPPRRRGSYVLPYTPASNSPVKSLANSRYPSPASTPYQYSSSQYSSASSTASSASGGAAAASKAAAAATLHEKSRKRVLHSPPLGVTGSGYALPPSKKNRGLKVGAAANVKQQQQYHQLVTLAGGSNSNSSSSSSGSSTAATTPLKRHHSLDETVTIEKRNLHNDMERQRRIGLKNLFDALKTQIPSIKDKDRAPKVNILREAAKLCEAMTREDQLLTEQRAVLRDQLRRKKEHVARLLQAAAAATAATTSSLAGPGLVALSD